MRDARQRLVTFTESCARYGISRVTGYKWLERAEDGDVNFLRSARDHRELATTQKYAHLGEDPTKRAPE